MARDDKGACHSEGAKHPRNPAPGDRQCSLQCGQQAGPSRASSAGGGACAKRALRSLAPLAALGDARDDRLFFMVRKKVED